ncbi:SRPBCC domain-containing protein [Kitasatospora phosalacinea]|uniref:SRPBCC family protein n=1 Tax=Kitasatospora phosalacinea TaxID=2065 RepID=UPI003654DB7C
MVDILHRIGVTASPEDVYAALTTVEGLAGWWTEDTAGDPAPGGVVRFRFPPGGFDMKVLEARPAEHVRWEVVEGPEEWIGTQVVFELAQEDDWTIVLFRHEGWREPVEFMHHCSTKWAVYLMSLKKLAETGAGEPSPRDVRIGNWH